MHPIGNERVIADAHQPTAPWAHFERRVTMFKFIGAAVVYGFAAFGLSKFLESISDDASESSG